MFEEELKLQARLSAIEHLVGLALSFAHAAAGHSVEQVRQIHGVFLEVLRAQSLCTGGDPVLSDVASDEIVLNVERILKGTETRLKQAPQPKP